MALGGFGAPPKPVPREKSAPKGLRSAGRKPKEAGRRYEQRFVRKYDEPDGPTDAKGKPLINFRRVPGSGAFVTLPGDVLAELVSLNLVFELKSWDRVNARGEKTVTFPLRLLTKIDEEAKQLNRVPLLIYHQKNEEEEWAVVRYSWLHEKLRTYELAIRDLTEQLEEVTRA